MPRVKKLRPQLAETGRLVDLNGIEVARLSPTGTYVLNEQAVYLWLLAVAATRQRNVPVTLINKEFSMSGGWSNDPYVMATLIKFEEARLIVTTKSAGGDIVTVEPRATPKKALNTLEPYHTRAEIFADLETIDE